MPRRVRDDEGSNEGEETQEDLVKRIAAAVFHAPHGGSRGEQLVEQGRLAAALDLTGRLREAGLEAVYIVTPNSAHRQNGAEGVEFLDSGDPAAFHFGRCLQDLVRRFKLDGVLYFGSGAGVLLSESELDRMVEFARGEGPRALFNNFYSCDFCAISGAPSLLRVELPEIDNPLGFVLADAEFRCFALPRSAATQFDIDTPIDVLLLQRSRVPEGALHRFLSSFQVPHPSLDRALAVWTDRSAVACVVGRLSPVTWSHIETQVACRTSALVEGRGMRAGVGPHVPWIRQALSVDGPAVFFDRLGRSCDAAWIDSRPLLGATDADPPAQTRFASDLFEIDEVADAGWRAFTEAARDARIPVVLGGHGLVSGGLYLAAEACWNGRNLARRLHPEPFVDTKERS